MAYTDLLGSNVLAYWSYDGQLSPDFGTYNSFTVTRPNEVIFQGPGIGGLGGNISARNDNAVCAQQNATDGSSSGSFSTVTFDQPLTFPYSFEFWYAFNRDTDSASRPESYINLRTPDNLSAGFVGISGSTISYTTGNSSGAPIQSTLTNAVGENTWNHIVFVYPDNDSANCKVYINGIIATGARAVPSAATLLPRMQNVGTITSPTVRSLGSAGGSGDTAQIAVQDGVVYNRALTREDVAQRYRYMLGDLDLAATIAAKNPRVWLNFDNVVPGNPTIFNQGTFQSSPDGASIKGGIEYNIDGIEGTKGIRLKYDQATGSLNSLSIFNVKEAIRQAMANNVSGGLGGYTIEWWQKIPPIIPGVTNNAKRVANATANNARNLQFSVEVGASSSTATTMFGHPTATLPYISGTSNSWLSGAPATNNANLQFVRFDDNQWHHVALTFTYGGSLATGVREQIVNIYIDGNLSRSRSYTTNANSFGNWGALPPTIDEFANPIETTIGQSVILTNDGRPLDVDSFAVYNYPLTVSQIQETYFAWVTSPYGVPPVAGQVKYWDGDSWETASAQKVWNGTEWIDWDHRYWNGTQWITL